MPYICICASIEHASVTVIAKYMRRKLACFRFLQMKEAHKRNKVLKVFLRRHLPGFMRWKRQLYRNSAIRIQSLYRGYHCRRDFYRYPDGEYYFRRIALAHWRLRYKLWALWKG